MIYYALILSPISAFVMGYLMGWHVRDRSARQQVEQIRKWWKYGKEEV